MIHRVRCVTAPLTREKRFSVTYDKPFGTWTASSTPSLQSLPGYGNVPCVPLLPPYPAVHCDTSISPLPSLTLILTKHHQGKKNPHPLPAQHTARNSPAMDAESIFQEERTLVPDYLRSRPQYQPIFLSCTNSDPTPTYVLMTRGPGLNSKFSTVVRHVVDLGPRPRLFSPSIFFLLRRMCPCRPVPPFSSGVASISTSSCRVNYTYMC